MKGFLEYCLLRKVVFKSNITVSIIGNRLVRKGFHGLDKALAREHPSITSVSPTTKAQLSLGQH